MMFPIAVPPGQYRNGTEYQSAGRWRDANLVRWQDGAMQPVGGWRSRATTGTAVDIAGTPRTMLDWVDNSGNRWVAFGCHDKLFVMDDEDNVFDITPVGFTAGNVSSDANFGWGAGGWGTLWWGEERADTGIISPATVWHLDTWGEYLVGGTTEDGKLYEWQLDTATPAAALSGAPTGCRGLVVTENRFLMALGADGNPRKVAWCDREDNTTWTAAPENEAGDQVLQTSGTIRRGLRVRGGTLILTDKDAHLATENAAFVLGFERVGTACGIIGRGAGITMKQGALWMGERGFYGYFGGAVEEIPCEVSDYVFTDINRGQVSKISAIPNREFGEIWWFYPSAGSTENDRYVSYDMQEQTWGTGTIERTAGVDAGTFLTPLYADAAGAVYEHEVGHRYDDATPFAETGPISIQSGDQIIQARLLYPDEKTQGDVTATFKTRFFPNGEERSYGPYAMSEPTGVRFAGRQVRMRVEGSGADWRVGTMRIDVVSGGGR